MTMITSPTDSQPVATWFRYCLLFTAIFNLFGAISFAPPVYNWVVNPLGLVNGTSPFSLWVIAFWILIFGVVYAWLAIKSQPEKLFIAVAAACKMASAILFFIYWFTGDLPLSSLFAGSGDFIFAILFIFWLFQTRQSTP
ncbi:MAG: hypothetical protein SAL70_41695 [Scytonema sp. PMC 1070.18]|nr:hypothetical protein [Scytonema sp. PMC 1070.18]